MLSPAILGGIVGALISTVLPVLFGAARQWVPRWFGFLRIAHVRTAAGVVFGITIGTAISLSISDHSHKKMTYIMWYGIAGVAFAVVLVATIVIEQRLARETQPHETADGAAAPHSATMNRRLRQQWHELRGARAARKADESALTPRPDETATVATSDLARPSMSHAIERLAAAATFSQHQRIEHLESLYFEGEQLSARLLTSVASIPGDLIQGTANQRQIQRERLAREWDGRVLADLPDDVRPKWLAAATLPRRSLEPASTIAGVREFLATKLACLKEIVSQLQADQ